MANPYIQIRDETMPANQFLKVAVLWSDFSEGPVSQVSSERSANGNLLVSIGKTYRMWRGVIKLNHNVPSGYATKANIEKWFASDNINERKLTVIDNLNRQFNAFVLTPVEIKYGSPIPDGVNGFYMIPFEMQTREAVTV